MPISGESEFREIEPKLDSLLAEARGSLEREGIEVVDGSLRSYHYKNQVLVWEVRLVREWLVDYERARVTVAVSFVERPDPAGPVEVEISRRSEIFQQGRPSRVLLRAERSVSLTALEHQGLLAVVSKEFEAGARELQKNS